MTSSVNLNLRPFQIGLKGPGEKWDTHIHTLRVLRLYHAGL